MECNADVPQGGNGGMLRVNICCHVVRVWVCVCVCYAWLIVCVWCNVCTWCCDVVLNSRVVRPNLVTFAVFTTQSATTPLLIMTCCVGDGRDTTMLMVCAWTSSFTSNKLISNNGFWTMTNDTELLNNRSLTLLKVLVGKGWKIKSWQSTCNTIALIVTSMFANMDTLINTSKRVSLLRITYLHNVRLPHGPGRQLTPSVVPQ